MKPLQFSVKNYYHTLYNGDSRLILKEQVQDCSLDAVIEDPPYGMNANRIDVHSFMECCLKDMPYVRTGKGIANQDWDKQFPSTDYFKEVFRALKPNGFYIGFCSGPNIGLFQLAAMCAGLEVIDLGAWFFGKGMTIGRKVTPNHHAEKIIDPRYSLGKAFEPILIARKPTENGMTMAENFKKYGTGVINCGEASYYTDGKLRHPTHAMWDGSTSIEELFGASAKYAKKCSSQLIDQIFAHPKPNHLEKNFGIGCGHQGYSIKGNLVEGLRNEHLTVKPIQLMIALIKTFTKTGDTVFDGYLGSGTSGIAALFSDRNFIGVEREKVYFEMACERLLNIKQLREKYPQAKQGQLILQFEYEYLHSELKTLSEKIALSTVDLSTIERFKKIKQGIQKIETKLNEAKKAA